MSVIKHTPGPWNCNRASAGGREIIVSEVTPVDVAVLSQQGKTHMEIEANARLIAAAPEMLEMLGWCRDWFEKHATSADLITGERAELPMLTSIRALLTRINGDPK